ncbi:putative 2-succinyl-6-hydroxy-2,4-cyclohexadiene-1-carboxylate synthase [Bacteriovorax sp. BSW11_IV]|uniref:alpha/beta fold hydrolase n=1 Tax=Bacteriovorax sp. BSW11_IV TaxID=1353529 RepID=UPI00038A3933|nr:alpha/beta fold hydrolase [Bacteriovorax sp. BSW11_IV]EQC49445.1 putative 2-succinyl-6-hydroxy-2,4-cyclohexadiene-1-carboxylate synthase [Bacteriovorax sp. BSW11_IV]
MNIFFCDNTNPDEYLASFLKCFNENIPFVALNPHSPESEKQRQKEEVLKSQREDFALVVFTSGSTGTPKGIVHSKENLLIAAKSSCEHYHFQKDETYGLTLPLFHIGGLMIALRMQLCEGHVQICDPSDVKSFLDPKINYLSLVSTQLLRLCEYLEKNKPTHNLKGIILGGARTPKETLERALSHNLLLSNSYGQSETCAQVMATAFTKNLSVLESVGTIMPYRNIKFDQGSIVISSPGIMMGHLDEKEILTEIRPTDSFEYKNNLFYVTGRTDQVFQSGGENINPEEIERELLELPGIQDALITNVHHPQFDQVAVCHIEVSKIENALFYKELLKTRLSSYKIPKCFYMNTNSEYLQKGIKKNRLLAKEHSLPESAFRKVCYGDPRRPMIVFLHGFMGQKEDFNEVIENLWQDYFCVAIDLPGHGESSGLHFPNWESLINELSSELKSYKRDIILYGYSQGARVAIALKECSSFITKLFIESGNAGIPEEEKKDRKKFEESFFQNIHNEEDFKNFLKKWYQMPLFGNILHHKNALKLLDKKYSQLEGFKKTLEYMSLFNQKNYWPEFENFSANTYFATGEYDLKYKGIGERFKKYGTELTLIPNASHKAHFESPMAISTWIRDKLSY